MLVSGSEFLSDICLFLSRGQLFANVMFSALVILRTAPDSVVPNLQTEEMEYPIENGAMGMGACFRYLPV